MKLGAGKGLWDLLLLSLWGSGPLVPYQHGNFASTTCQPHTPSSKLTELRP